MVGKRVLLIDGDVFAYKFAAGAQHSIDWSDDQDGSEMTLHADLDDARANLDESLRGLLKTLEADAYEVALSDPDANFRKDLTPTYKAHRADVLPPVIRRALEDHLVSTHRALRKPRLEGDDILGIWATNPRIHPRADKVVVSADKDMQTIPGKLFRGGKLQRISREEADHYHLFQTLTGDATDGYKGCPGIGPAKAEKWLAAPRFAHQPPWFNVLSAYLTQGLTEADAILQARLARILRHTDYDYERKEPILWTP